MRVLTTGFGPFGRFDSNPSAWLVEQCGRPHVVLPVSYAEVDRHVAGLDASTFDILVMVGVHGRARKMRLEQTARNTVGAHPDVDGHIAGPGLIDPLGPPLVKTRLSSEAWWPGAEAVFTRTDDAGAYLCNWIFYRAASRFQDRCFGFVHVPDWRRLDRERQSAAFGELLARLEALPGPPMTS